MALNLIVLGPPGAGKGTQAEQLSQARGLPKISSGDMLRDAEQAGTDIGKRAAAIMKRGELVGDDVMIGIVRERLEQPDALKGFVLDGFPRTVAQAVALDAVMAGRDPLIIVDITAPEDELVRRMLSRLICQNCRTIAEPGTDPSEPCRKCGGRLGQRADDNEATVRERLRVYRRDTKALVDYYSPRPTFRSVNGAQRPDVVAADLVSAIASAAGGLAASQGVNR
jgi:adenylate kinase